MSFSSDLRKFNRKFEGTSNDLISGIEMALFKAVILDSPVDTGRFRANWLTSKSRPAKGSTENTDKEGARTIAATHAFLGALKGGRVTFLVNNLPYAKKLEEGSSRKAPAGMVRKNVARFKRIVNEQAIRVRR